MKTRRLTVLARASVVGAALPANAASSTCGAANLVQAAGTRFRCGNRPFRFVGANSRDLVYLYNKALNDNGFDGPAAARVVYEHLRVAEEMGVTVLRVYLPREEKAPADFPSLAQYHAYFASQLRYLIEFATLPGPFTQDEGIDDYRKYRVEEMAAPPAPGMKFLVVLSDSIYACDREPWGNLVLRGDVAAFPPGSGGDACPPPSHPNLNFFSTEWYRRNGTPANYTEHYKPFVRAVASAFYRHPAIFGFELVNEAKAASARDMRSFVSDMVCAVKGISCANRAERELSAQDRSRLVGGGFISAWHAAGCPSGTPACAAGAQEEIYGRTGLDFGGIHQYDDSNAHFEDLDATYLASRLPYVVGEFSYSGTNRGALVHAGLRRTFGQSADGVLQWGFYGGTNAQAAAFMSDSLGMNRSQDDWADLYAEYRCRALRLDHANARRRGVDVVLAYLDWENLTRPGSRDVAVGEAVRFHARVCNAGNRSARLGQGLGVFVDNDGANPQIMANLGSVFVPDTLWPGDLVTIDFDWTVIDPGTLDPRITLDNAVIVGLADDVNRYPNEITEANNGYAVPFPIQACPGAPLGDRQACCAPVALVNPSFEQPTISPPWERHNAIPGWVGPIDIHHTSDLPASDGVQVADLNQNSFGYLGTTFETAAGTTYTVRWAQGINHHCTSSASLSVDVDGASVGTFTSNAVPAYKEVAFTASSASTALRFRSLTGGCGAATIDDVSVTCQ